MKNRKIIVLLSLAILLLAVVNLAVFMCGGEESGISRTMTLLSPSAPVSSLRIERTDSAPVMIAKSSEWRMVEPYSSEVDEQTVLKFIDALSQTIISDTISDSELLKLGRVRGDFDLENPPLRIKVSCDERSINCAFGAKTPAGDGVYAAIDGVNAVFVVPADILAALDIPVDRFRKRLLIDAVPEAIAGFAIKHAAGSRVAFARDGENWKVDGENASSDKVAKLLSEILSASVSRFVWPTALTNEVATMSAALLSTYGLDPESAVTLTVSGVDGGSDIISFGKASSEGEVYALVQRGGAVATVDAKLKELAMQEAAAYTDARIFPFESSAVRTIVLADADVSYSFLRGKGEEWRMETPVVALADSKRVEALLNRILTLTSADISQEGLSVSLSSNAAAVVFSRSAVLGDTRIEDLRSTEILKIDPVTVKRIVMVSSDKSEAQISVVYDRNRRAWNVESSPTPKGVDESAIASVLSAVNPLRAERIERMKVSLAELSDYGLETPRLTVAIDQDVEKDMRRNIMIGDKVDGGYYATVGSSGAVFILANEVVSRITAPIVAD